MKRRDFIALSGAAAAFPRAAFAQQTRPVPRAPGGRPWLIGALVGGTKVQSDINSFGPFRTGLAALGYMEGRDYTVEERYADGDTARFDAIAKDLVSLKPDVVMTSQGATAVSARLFTQTIPVVAFFGGTDIPVMSALVGNISKPIGNVTGIFNDAVAISGKHVDLASELLPKASRIGALAYSAGSDGGRATRDAVTAAAVAHGLAPTILYVSQPAEVAPAFRSLADQRMDAIVVGSGTVFAGDRARTVQAATDVRMPTIYNEQGYVEAGGLLSYGFDRKATFVRMAGLADLMLRGAKPADVPTEGVSSFNLAINIKTAKSLGLTIPPTVLFRADVVIE